MTTKSPPDKSAKYMHLPQDIYVTSLQEYKTRMSAVAFYQKVSVIINLENLLSWPPGAELNNAYAIREITIIGNDLGIVAIDILQQLSLVERIKIFQTANGSCSSQSFTGRPKQVLMSRVRSVTFDGLIDQCYAFLYMFYEGVKATGLEYFEIKNSLLTKEKVGYVRGIIGAAKTEIKSIVVAGTTLLAPVFEDQLGTMTKLEVLWLDLVQRKHSQLQHVGPKFHLQFPMLTNFTSTLGSLPWNQFQNLLNCRSLRHIQTNVEMSSFEKVVNFDDFTEQLPDLSSTELFFTFQNTVGESNCKVIGCAEARKRNKNMRCESNCISTAEAAHIEKVINEYNVR